MNEAGFGLYVHWPYCGRICPYCDFNVYRARGRDTGFLINALIADIEGHAARIARRGLTSVFFGGGTPSLLAPESVARILAAARIAFGFEAGMEVTLEANPEDAARFAEFVGAGVTRLSVGVQALRDDALRGLGRNHDADAARKAVETAARSGARVSIDLIYARDGQTPDEWEAELQDALALPAEHLSLYQLTVEEGTAFDRAVRRGRISPPGSEAAAALYELTQRVCAARQAPAYEISNHARGDAARSLHNLVYWRGGDWIGVGPGAHGRIPVDGARWATTAFDRPEAYAETVASVGVGWSGAARLSNSEIGEERVLMGLRIAEGFDRRHAEALLGRRLRTEVVSPFLVETEGRLALTDEGRLVADRVAAELLAP